MISFEIWEVLVIVALLLVVPWITCHDEDDF